MGMTCKVPDGQHPMDCKVVYRRDISVPRSILADDDDDDDDGAFLSIKDHS